MKNKLKIDWKLNQIDSTDEQCLAYVVMDMREKWSMLL